MRALRRLLVFSLVVAPAVAWGVGAALAGAGVSARVSMALAALVLVMVAAPSAVALWWTWRRAVAVERLVERTRAVAGGTFDRAVAGSVDGDELDALARAIDELRMMLLGQASAQEEHRAAMDEILASLGEGLLAVNDRGRVVVANPRIAEMFGSRELLGRTILEVVRQQTVVTALERALRGEPTSDRIVVGSEGAERHVEVRAVPVAASRDIAAVALFIDVSAIERLQRVRKDFLDDFSHEVRTPLAGLRSATETLEHENLGADEEKQLRRVIQRQSARIERLVNDLAELNRIESGQIVLQRRPLDLRQLLSELCEDFRQRAPAAAFVVRGGETVAAVDAERAQQIFSNLLDNAWKHGGGRGDIAVEVGREDGEAVVRVLDQGPGIPSGELDRVFHRFYRVDRSRSQPGTGLGLAIAKHLVVAHGGTIRAYNAAGGGAVFEVRLPAA